MNKAISKKWIFLTVIFLIAVGFTYIFDPFVANSGWPSSLSSNFSETGLFRMDPGTVIASLNKGNVDVFLPDSRSLEDRVNGTVLYDAPVSWSQSDNLKIVSALDGFVWGDTVGRWNLFSMTFSTDCQSDLNGVSGSVFKYFKTNFDKGRITYTWRQIEINSEYAYVAWGGGAEFAHPLLGWKSIDLSGLKISAEDAIRIAEENGGRETRSNVQNQCNIYLLLMPERYSGWLVDYQSTDFEIQIDPDTGEIIN
jgi:hypothetical protein